VRHKFTNPSNRKPKLASKPARHYTDLPIHPTAEYLGRLQAAHLLGVNVQTIDAMIKAEREALPAYRFGRRVLVKRADLIQRLEANRL
jgi:excisionase family DNA binding protein